MRQDLGQGLGFAQIADPGQMNDRCAHTTMTSPEKRDKNSHPLMTEMQTIYLTNQAKSFF